MTTEKIDSLEFKKRKKKIKITIAVKIYPALSKPAWIIHNKAIFPLAFGDSLERESGHS